MILGFESLPLRVDCMRVGRVLTAKQHVRDGLRARWQEAK